jgi:hypothetical protein
VNHLSSSPKIKAVHFPGEFSHSLRKSMSASLAPGLAFTQQFLEARVVALKDRTPDQEETRSR